MRAHGAHAGIAHDGDADRCIAVDERGELVDGDQIMAICALDLKARAQLPGDTLVATVMSNMGLELLMRAHGILVRTKVGDRYVLEEMLKGGFGLGGEQSGHVIFGALHHGRRDSDRVQLLSVSPRERQPLRSSPAAMQRLPQVAGRTCGWPQGGLGPEPGHPGRPSPGPRRSWPARGGCSCGPRAPNR